MAAYVTDKWRWPEHCGSTRIFSIIHINIQYSVLYRFALFVGVPGLFVLKVEPFSVWENEYCPSNLIVLDVVLDPCVSVSHLRLHQTWPWASEQRRSRSPRPVLPQVLHSRYCTVLGNILYSAMVAGSQLFFSSWTHSLTYIIRSIKRPPHLTPFYFQVPASQSMYSKLPSLCLDLILFSPM